MCVCAYCAPLPLIHPALCSLTQEKKERREECFSLKGLSIHCCTVIIEWEGCLKWPITSIISWAIRTYIIVKTNSEIESVMPAVKRENCGACILSIFYTNQKQSRHLLCSLFTWGNQNKMRKWLHHSMCLKSLKLWRNKNS